MALSEQLFCADSEAVLAIVATLSGDEGADARWRLTLRGMDQLLDDLGFGLADKLTIVRGARVAFAREFDADAALEKQLGDQFRRERLSLEMLLDRQRDEASSLAPGCAILGARSERARPIGEQLRALAAAGRLTLTMEALAPSYLHMHANRLLRSAARAQELVIYDLLARLYESQTARARRPR